MLDFGIMPPLMFGVMVLFMLIGFPVAFSLATVGLFFGILGTHTGHFGASFLQALPFRFYGIISNDLLLSIPFFTSMGAILERCGLAEDLLEGTGQLFGKIPGGLAYAVILVGAILGAITGTVAASVIAMGVISLPIMMRYGYDMRLATGVIAASGTITQLIPPSLVLIVLADQLGKSVGDMYLGAIGPSILQVVIFLLYVVGLSIVRPNSMPPLPEGVREPLTWKLVNRVLWGMIPSIVLIFLVLGTIGLGLATPTEAGAMGAVGAMVLAALHRRLTWPLVAGDEFHDAPHLDGGVHSDRFDVLQPGVSGDGWRAMDRALADRATGRGCRVSRVREHLCILPGVLPRFLRDCIHHFAAARARRKQARHRPDLVWRPALRQHADIVHAPAVRLRVVLFASHCAAGGQKL
jgi:TRAP-type mannitol/chloroaromatic compound transport system permease large subunit